MMTISIPDHDKITASTASSASKAPRAPAFHSALSEHFDEQFPLYVNRWEEGFDLREHNHAYLEIVYVMSGEGYHYVGSAVERTSKGCLYIVPIGTSHVLRPSDNSRRSRLIVYNVCIRPEFLAELGAWLGRYGRGEEMLVSLFGGAPGTHISLLDKQMQLAPLFEQMLREYEDQPFGFETSLFGHLFQLTVRAARLQHLSVDTSGIAGDRDRTPRSVLTPILAYIDTHAADPLTARQMAEQAGISERHFLRLFRRAANMGFTDYLQLRRVELACRLLLATDDKITAIAKNTGYRDPSHFREVFRSVMGTTPNKYRKERQK